MEIVKGKVLRIVSSTTQSEGKDGQIKETEKKVITIYGMGESEGKKFVYEAPPEELEEYNYDDDVVIKIEKPQQQLPTATIRSVRRPIEDSD